MKKKHYFKNAIIAVTAMMMSTGLQAQNLLVNGDFEATEAPWGWSRNNTDILLSEANDFKINNQTCRMPGLGAARWIWQNVEISAAGKFFFEFTGRIQNAAPFDSGTSPNSHATLGPATLKGEIFGFEADGSTLLPDALLTLETQSNSNITLKGEIEIPDSITKVQVKISKNWNVPYVDDVFFYLEGTLGVATNTMEDLNIYSKDGALFVTSSTQLNQISIFDITGQMIHTIKAVNKTHEQISTGNFRSGIYLITATDIDGRTGAVKHIIR